MSFVTRLKDLIYVGLSSLGVYVSLQPPKSDSFNTDLSRRMLAGASGVLHIGASAGQEASTYNDHQLPVIWIEAIPQVHQQLMGTISAYENQRSVCSLLGDENGKIVTFNIASNAGESLSIFDLAQNHGFLDGELTMTESIELKMRRLDSLFSASELRRFSHWVIDVQGAELLVLQGSGDLLKLPMSIEVEVSTRKVYEGGATYEEIRDFLAHEGFVPAWTFPENSHGDLLFVRAR